MDKKETEQHVKDVKTAERAIEDNEKGKYDPPISPLNPLPSSSRLHEDEVYRSAWKESDKQD